MGPAIFGRDEDGRRRGVTLRFTPAEWVASTGLLMIAVGVTIAVMTATPLALLPSITYAIAVGMAYLVYRHYLRARQDSVATAEPAKQNASLQPSFQPSFQMNVHPLLEAGWEDALGVDVPGWVDPPAATYFKVVGSRGICPRGITQGDFLKLADSGSVTPSLCAEAEAVLRMAVADDSEVREWCCPVYDHLLVFKKLEKIS